MQTRDIKRRMRSVKNTQQITRAMKFVSAAKLRRAQDQMLAIRPYADYLDGILRNLSQDLVGDEHPLFQSRTSVKRVAIVVIAGDRGLCGGFNTAIIRETVHFVGSLYDAQPVFFAIGKRAIGGLRKLKYNIVKSYHDVFDKLSYVLASEICRQLVERMASKSENDRIDAAYVIYNQFVSMITQKPVVRQLLPFDLKAMRAGKPSGDASAVTAESPAHGRLVYELLPDPVAAVEKLVARRLATDVFRNTIESYTAELAARMSSMDNATKNADDMMSGLSLKYNRARQSGITTELMDIIGGASALG